jgi:hypothetical protein
MEEDGKESQKKFWHEWIETLMRTWDLQVDNGQNCTWSPEADFGFHEIWAIC